MMNNIVSVETTDDCEYTVGKNHQRTRDSKKYKIESIRWIDEAICVYGKDNLLLLMLL